MSKSVFLLLLTVVTCLENYPCDAAKSTVSKGDLQTIGNILWQNDVRVRGIIFHVQGEFLDNETKIVEDRAPARLFAPLTNCVFNRTTFSRFFSVLDNYETDTKIPENETAEEEVEVEQFLDSILASNVMKEAWNFLVEKNLSSADEPSFREQLRSMWFGLYPRGHRVNSSCGFEHVFRGEIRNTKVSGFHNWMRFYFMEQQGDVDYKGHYHTFNIGKGHVIQSKFSWGSRQKPVTSFFVGTTPEFELALYTICFYARPNGLCKVQLNQKNLLIQTNKINQNGVALVGSAYPVI